MGEAKRKPLAAQADARWPDMPDRMKARPVDHRGFPVPWFVAWIDGRPDFRVVGPGKVEKAVRGQCCWLCGERLGVNLAFVIGPMCAVNRVSSEPPSHLDCAEFAVRACPFLTQPRMRRNEKGLPTEAVEPPGEMIRRNPGVALVWVTRRYSIRQGLFTVGDPVETRWYAEGRMATRAEVQASIDSGLPLLLEAADKDGPRALAQLARQLDAAKRLMPA